MRFESLVEQDKAAELEKDTFHSPLSCLMNLVKAM